MTYEPNDPLVTRDPKERTRSHWQAVFRAEDRRRQEVRDAVDKALRRKRP